MNQCGCARCQSVRKREDKWWPIPRDVEGYCYCYTIHTPIMMMAMLRLLSSFSCSRLAKTNLSSWYQQLYMCDSSSSSHVLNLLLHESERKTEALTVTTEQRDTTWNIIHTKSRIEKMQEKRESIVDRFWCLSVPQFPFTLSLSLSLHPLNFPFIFLFRWLIYWWWLWFRWRWRR